MFLPRLCIPRPALCALAAAALSFGAAVPGSFGARWRATGPFGGPVEAIAADPLTHGRFLAGSPDGLLSITADGGEHWAPVHFPGEMVSALHALHFVRSRAGRILAGVSPDSPTGPGLYETNDLGVTWTPLSAFAGKSVWALAAFPGDASRLAAGVSDGVYSSRDAGATWSRVSPANNPELSPAVSVAFDPNDPDTIYAGTTHLPWKTTDAGRSWRSIHKGMLDDSDVFSIEVDPARPRMVLLSACSGIYRSGDGGATWIKMRGSADASYRTYTIVRDPANGQHIFAGTSHGLLRSVDEGKTWGVTLQGAAKSVVFDPEDRARIIVATVDRGLFRSADGGSTFEPVDHGRVSRHFHSLLAAGDRLYAGAYDRSGALFVSDDGGQNWSEPSPKAVRTPPAPVPARKKTLRRRGKSRRAPVRKAVAAAPAPQAGFLFTAAAPDQPETLFAASAMALRRSTDGGRTWSPMRGPGSGGIVTALLIRRGLTPVISSAPAKPVAVARKTPAKRKSRRGRRRAGKAPPPKPVAVAPAVPGIEVWLATTNGLYRGNETGAAWRKLSANVSGIRHISDSGGRIFVIGRGAEWSIDEGTTWSNLRAPMEGAEFNAVAAFESTILAATSHGLFRTTDDGGAWEPAPSPVKGDSVGTVVFHRARPAVAFAAQYGTIFVSQDAGETWSKLDGTLGTNSIHTLVLSPERPGRIYALVAGRGIYYSDWEDTK
ncbi:MAG: hypothetical protein R2729_22535 [Bryobacteraceae bacterium]